MTGAERDGAVLYVEREAPASWRPFVTRFWYLEAPRTQPYEKILPLPFVHVIVNLSDPYRLLDESGNATPVNDAFASGIQPAYLVIECPPVLRHVGVEFTPQGLRAFSEVSPTSVTARVCPADDVLPGIHALAHNLRALLGGGAVNRRADKLIDALIDALSTFLSECRRPGVDADPIASLVLAGLDRDPQARIGAFADRAGVTHKTLIAHFVAACGIAPKRYAEVLRFHRFVTDLPIGADMPNWTDLAATSSYYDQPDVIHAFRRYSGYTPADYLRRVRQYGPDAAAFVPLDELPAVPPSAS